MSIEFITTIGSEIIVTVLIDYQPSEPRTHDEPGCEEEISIYKVLVNGDKDADILEELSEECCDRLVDHWKAAAQADALGDMEAQADHELMMQQEDF